MQAAKRD